MIRSLLTFFAGATVGFGIAAILAAAGWADREMERMDEEARPWVIPSDDRDDSST
jgi:hypothetical protein